MTAAEKADVEQFALEEENRRLEARVKELEAQVENLKPTKSLPCPTCGGEINDLFDLMGADSVSENDMCEIQCPHCNEDLELTCDDVSFQFSVVVP